MTRHTIPALFTMPGYETEEAAAAALADILDCAELVGEVEDWCLPNHPEADGSDSDWRVEFVRRGPRKSASGAV